MSVLASAVTAVCDMNYDAYDMYSFFVTIAPDHCSIRQLTIEGQSVLCLVDTGSDINVLPKGSIDNLQLEPTIQ